MDSVKRFPKRERTQFVTNSVCNDLHLNVGRVVHKIGPNMSQFWVLIGFERSRMAEQLIRITLKTIIVDYGI